MGAQIGGRARVVAGRRRVPRAGQELSRRVLRRVARDARGNDVGASVAEVTGLPLRACMSQAALAASVGVAVDELLTTLTARGDGEVAALAAELPA